MFIRMILICIEHALDEALYWAKDIQKNHFDTIRVASSVCRAVDANIRVSYDSLGVKKLLNIIAT